MNRLNAIYNVFLYIENKMPELGSQRSVEKSCKISRVFLNWKMKMLPFAVTFIAIPLGTNR